MQNVFFFCHRSYLDATFGKQRSFIMLTTAPRVLEASVELELWALEVDGMSKRCKREFQAA